MRKKSIAKRAQPLLFISAPVFSFQNLSVKKQNLPALDDAPADDVLIA